MKIAVCIKRVPDTEMRFGFTADGKAVDPGGLKFEISTFDEYAVEVAIRLKEQAGGGEVTVVGLGPAGMPELLRRALSMGADRAVHLEVPEVPFDGAPVARALAAALRDGGFDLILFGRQATDTGHGSVGPIAAALLDLPCVTSASALSIADGKGAAERQLEGAVESIEFSLPAVVTIDEGIARPRIPALKGIMAAKKKPLDTRPVSLENPHLTIEKLEFPPERPPGRIVGEGAEAVPELVRLLREEAKVI